MHDERSESVTRTAMFIAHVIADTFVARNNTGSPGVDGLSLHTSIYSHGQGLEQIIVSLLCSIHVAEADEQLCFACDNSCRNHCRGRA